MTEQEKNEAIHNFAAKHPKRFGALVAMAIAVHEAGYEPAYEDSEVLLLRKVQSEKEVSHA